MSRFAVVTVAPERYVHAAAFAEVAEALDGGLRELGHDSVRMQLRNGADLGAINRRLIVLGSNLLAPGIWLPDDSILYNLEQIDRDSPWLPGLVPLFKRFEVWDYSPRNGEKYPTIGLPLPKIVPIGYVPSLTRIDRKDPDIDVLFYGSMNARRARVLEEIQESGLRVAYRPGIYGSERDQLIARSKVVLNLHFYAAQVFEVVRVSYLLANRVAVVSEGDGASADEAPFADGVAFASYGRLVERCAELCSNERERESLAARGFRAITARPQASFLRVALGSG